MKFKFLQNGKHFDNNLAIVRQAVYEAKLKPQLLEGGVNFNDHSGGGVVSVRNGKVQISYPNHPILYKYKKVYSA